MVHGGAFNAENYDISDIIPITTGQTMSVSYFGQFMVVSNGLFIHSLSFPCGLSYILIGHN